MALWPYVEGESCNKQVTSCIRHWGCSSGVENSPGTHTSMSSIFSATKMKKKPKKRCLRYLETQVPGDCVACCTAQKGTCCLPSPWAPVLILSAAELLSGMADRSTQSAHRVCKQLDCLVFSLRSRLPLCLPATRWPEPSPAILSLCPQGPRHLGPAGWSCIRKALGVARKGLLCFWCADFVLAIWAA